MTAPLRIAFLLSGSGTTLENVFRHIDMGVIRGTVVVVVSDRAGVHGLDRARARGVATAVVERKAYHDGDAFSRAVEAAIRPHAPDLVVMGGFLSLWRVPSDWKGRVLNVIRASFRPSRAGASTASASIAPSSSRARG